MAAREKAMSNDQCREAFESFYSTNGMHNRVIERSGGSYSLPEAAVAWWVWKTCWNHLQQKPEQVAAGPVAWMSSESLAFQPKGEKEQYRFLVARVQRPDFDVPLFTTPPTPDADAKDAALREALIIAIGSIMEICAERGIPLPESTIRRSEGALAAQPHDTDAQGADEMLAESAPAEPKRDGGWIAWGGFNGAVECPVSDGTLVDIRYRDGTQRFGIPALQNVADAYDAGYAYWRHDNAINDIVAYRVVKP